ncbi:fibronectin type III domain-containing protein [Flagellimonas myxillae]|uniref:fibronectin type III domain-containing protein n=1 Tax=Flagellimonas myxillae TaxID=2942214 RepID=UPI00201F5EDE|nr:fibronectin type III domain-containing protein [Muricauda myxillae]MCL6266920.1 fibronectin type III domain-containing protein [Muricauda myxillae]
MKSLLEYFGKCWTIGFFLFTSCSSGEDATPPRENRVPSAPKLVYPTNNLLCINNVLTFDWEASTDPDSDGLTYEVQVATDNQFSTLVHSGNTNSTEREITLQKGTAHYWRVGAMDTNGGKSEYSNVWQFFTEGEGQQNHLPFAPSLISPEMDSVTSTNSVVLQWSASDVDGDELVFDIHFGTDTSPNRIATAQSETNFTLNDLNADTTYYWKIVVKDSFGASTIGSIWNFTIP